MCLDRSSSPAAEMNLKDIAFEGAKKFLTEGRIFKVRAQPLGGRRFELFITTNTEAPPEWLSNFSVTLIVQDGDQKIPIRYKVLNVNDEGMGVSYTLRITPARLRDIFLAYRYLKIFSGYSSNVVAVQFVCDEQNVEVKNSY